MSLSKSKNCTSTTTCTPTTCIPTTCTSSSDEGPEELNINIAKENIIELDKNRRRDISLRKNEKKIKEEEARIKNQERRKMIDAALEELKTSTNNDENDLSILNSNHKDSPIVKKIKAPKEQQEEEEIDEVKIEGSNDFIKIIDSKPKLPKFSIRKHEVITPIKRIFNTLNPLMIGKASFAFSSDKHPSLQGDLLKKFERTQRPPKVRK